MTRTPARTSATSPKRRASAPTARLILSEYAKYVVAQLRMRIEPVPGLTDTSGGRHGAKS